MSWFNLKQSMGTNYTVDPGDIINTKKALSQLGYYDVPPHRGIDDWTDDAMFDGIRAFQKANNLKVDGFMRPGGPTEAVMNASLTEGEIKPGLGEGEMPLFGSGKGGVRWPGDKMPVGVPPNMAPKMPVFTEPPVQYHGRPHWDKSGFPVVDGKDTRNGGIIRPPKGPY